MLSLQPIARKCFCYGSCPNTDDDMCDVRPGGKCYTFYEEFYDEEQAEFYVDRRFGCLPPDAGTTLQCTNIVHSSRKFIECCNDADFCNLPKDDSTTLPPFFTNSPPVVPEKYRIPPKYLVLMGIVSLMTIILTALICCAFIRCCRKRKLERKQTCLMPGSSDTTVTNLEDANCVLFPDCKNAKEVVEKSKEGLDTSIPLSMQRTVAKQVALMQLVGTGKYSEYWIGQWLGQLVSVKIFSVLEEPAWFRETEIYQIPLFRHKNILGFIAADIKSASGWIQMLVITAYHENGSLYEYLRNNVIDKRALVTMAESVANGMSHLHNEIIGSQRKPPIAHRNLKSKNILIKADGSCCLSDFSIAVQFCSETNTVDIGNSSLTAGTVRYMAPEVLNNTIKATNFEHFKRADMYSLGLVLWEMTRRCLVSENKIVTPEEAQLPYFDMIGPDPTFAEMSDVVHVKKIRPPLSPSWQNDFVLSTFAKTMQECWHHNASSRLTALRVKKTISKFTDNSSKFSEAVV